VWWNREKKDVSEFLYRLLVTEAPRGRAAEVAERMDVPYPTLSKYWLGHRRFPAALLKPLFLATGQDARIGEFFLTDGTDYTLTRRNPEPAPRDPARSIVELQRLQGRLGEMFLDATAADSEQGPAISPKEAAELRARLDDLIAHAQRLRAAFG
jgi:hypothetical protein